MEIKTTNHPYYCNLGNYYVPQSENGGLMEYDSWKDFYSEWVNSDPDFNLLFRFDIVTVSDENDKPIETKDLHLFYIQQRKGNFLPIIVHGIKPKNMLEINEYLKSYWDYMKTMWTEFSKIKNEKSINAVEFARISLSRYDKEMKQSSIKEGKRLDLLCTEETNQSNTIASATKIKSARKSAGLTQLAMSKRLGIPTRTIEDWEAGKSHPSDWVVKLVVDKLSCIKKSLK